MSSSTPKPPVPPGQNPAEIAREAFRRLATLRIAPTPDAYRDIYDEIAGGDSRAQAAAPALPDPGAENVLSSFAHRLSDTPGELAEFGVRLNRAVKQRD